MIDREQIWQDVKSNGPDCDRMARYYGRYSIALEVEALKLAEALGEILTRVEDANQEFVRLDIAAIARQALAEREQA